MRSTRCPPSVESGYTGSQKGTYDVNHPLAQANARLLTHRRRTACLPPYTHTRLARLLTCPGACIFGLCPGRVPGPMHLEFTRRPARHASVNSDFTSHESCFFSAAFGAEKTSQGCIIQ